HGRARRAENPGHRRPSGACYQAQRPGDRAAWPPTRPALMASRLVAAGSARMAYHVVATATGLRKKSATGTANMVWVVLQSCVVTGVTALAQVLSSLLPYMDEPVGGSGTHCADALRARVARPKTLRHTTRART